MTSGTSRVTYDSDLPRILGCEMLGKIMGRRWKALNESERQEYLRLSRADTLRYRREMIEFERKQQLQGNNSKVNASVVGPQVKEAPREAGKKRKTTPKTKKATTSRSTSSKPPPPVREKTPVLLSSDESTSSENGVGVPYAWQTKPPPVAAVHRVSDAGYVPSSLLAAAPFPGAAHLPCVSWDTHEQQGVSPSPPNPSPSPYGSGDDCNKYDGGYSEARPCGVLPQNSTMRAVPPMTPSYPAYPPLGPAPAAGGYGGVYTTPPPTPLASMVSPGSTVSAAAASSSNRTQSPPAPQYAASSMPPPPPPTPVWGDPPPSRVPVRNGMHVMLPDPQTGVERAYKVQYKCYRMTRKDADSYLAACCGLQQQKQQGERDDTTTPPSPPQMSLEQLLRTPLPPGSREIVFPPPQQSSCGGGASSSDASV